MSSALTPVEHTRARKLAYLKSLERGGGFEPVYNEALAISDFLQAAGEVVAKRRRDPATTITLTELRANYAETARRRDLLDMLDAEINAWRASYPSVRCWIFGSFLSRKSEPGDIDTLVSALPSRFPPVLPRLHRDDIQVLSSLAIPQLNKEQLVADFNNQHNNKANEIMIDADEAVELLW